MNNHQDKENPWMSMTFDEIIMTPIHSSKQEKQTQNMENEVRQRKPIPFREEKKWCRNGVWERFGSVLVEREMEKIVNSHKNLREKLKKVLKTVFEMQNTRFSRLKWVANKLPGLAAETLKDTNFKKISKCFSRLEDLPARESRAELRKSLCNPCDWTFHSRTSRQN